MGEKNDKNPAVLIVGDWLVDEYWFLVRHHSEISSHTGFSHYRLASKKGDIVSDLCGAGHVARIFYDLNFSNKKRYQIYGLVSRFRNSANYFGILSLTISKNLKLRP